MKICELELTNFAGIYATMHRTFVRLNLRKSKNKICLITGPNGHGKTVLLSQLNPFATLGTVDERDSLQLILEGKEGHKKIIIQDEENEYEIDHFYSPNKSTHSVKSYIKKNGDELNPNGNVTSFKEIIKNELDMEQEYMKLVRLGNNVTNLIELKSSERKTFMSKILEDADIYLKYYKKINMEVGTLKTLISHTTDKINKLNVDDVDGVKEKLKKEEKELKELDESILKLNDTISVIEFQIGSIPPVDMEKLLDSEVKLKKMEKKLKEKSSISVESLKNDEVELSLRIATNTERLRSLKSSLDNSLDTMDSTRSSINILSQQLSRIEDSTDIIGLTNIIVSLEKTIKEEEERFKPYGEIGYTRKDIENFLAFIKEKQEVLNTTYEFGSEVVKKVCDLLMKDKNVISYIEDHLRKATEDEEIDNGKSIIKRVFSRYPKFSIPSKCTSCEAMEIINDFQMIANIEKDSELKSKEFYTYMNMAYNNIKGVLLSFSENKELFLKLPEYIRKEYKTDVLLKKIGKTEMVYDQKLIFDELSFITDYELYLSHQEELENKETELKTMAHESSLKSLKKQIKELSLKLEQTTSNYSKETELFAEISRSLEKDKDELSELHTLIEALENKNELESFVKESNDSLKKKDQYKEEKFTKTKLRDSMSLEKNKITRDISLIQYTLKQLEEFKKELKVYQKYYDEWILMKESLSANKGIPLIFIDLYLKKSLNVVNALLDRIYNGRVYVEKFDIAADSFTIPFVKEGTNVPDIRYASQGEKSFFSISLSFAISFQSMSKYNIMLLDELDSVLDESNRSNFIQIIEELIDMINADQIFIISHNNMFSMYPVDVVSVVNELPKDNNLANYIEIEYEQ